MTDNKLADAIAKAEQWTCLVCDEPEIERTILVALEALAEHDAEKAKPDGDYVLVPRVPTPDMLSDAGTMENYDIDAGGRADDDHIAWWSAMLAAAPQPAPAPVQVDGAGALPPLPHGDAFCDIADWSEESIGLCGAWSEHLSINSRYTMPLYTESSVRTYARAAIATLQQPVPDAETAKLIEFFRKEGYMRFGLNGDNMGWSPAETAIRAMREYMSKESSLSQQPEAR